MLMRGSAVLLGWYGSRIARDRERETIAREMLPLADKIITILIFLIGLATVFEHFGVEIRSILVTLGVGSLAIGLALQDTLANMFGGFTIMLDRPFRIGDRIQLETGEVGDVQGIGMRSTSVLLPNGNLLIVPNAHLVKNVITNHSYPDSRSVLSVHVSVAAGSDVALAKQLMLDAARENSRIMKDPPPKVFFKSFGEAALNLVLVCHVPDFRDTMTAADELNYDIDLKFKGAHIHLPLSLAAHLHKEPLQEAK
jgi:small-conductance mechanosensitive channel